MEITTTHHLAPGADWDGTPCMIRKPLGPITPSKGARRALARRDFTNAEVLQGAGLLALSAKGTPMTLRGGFINR